MNKISDFDFADMYICKMSYTKMCENYLHADIKVEIKKTKKLLYNIEGVAWNEIFS